MDKAKRFIKKHPRLHYIARKLKRSLVAKTPVSSTFRYEDWIKNLEPTLWKGLSKHAEQKLISIIVPTYNTPDKYLEPLISSLLEQTYTNWELCISDASTDVRRQEAIRDISGADKRIKYVSNPGLHISENTNEGLNIATGEYIGLLDHDDVLSKHALEEVAVALDKTNADIIYSDEDKLSDDGKERQLPFFKPGWSPDMLLGVNYITHFLVVKKVLIEKVGGLRSEYNGAQDYDLLLRLTELTEKIVHIPKILYHWRLADGSTAKTVGEKNYADDAGQRALRDAVQRRAIKAKVVEIPDRPTNYRIVYDTPSPLPLVSIVIPFKDKSELLRVCVDSIFTKTTYSNYELVLVSNNSEEDGTESLLEELRKDKRVNVFYWDNPFNYSKVNNFGVGKAKGQYVVLLNNDTEVITGGWLEELVGVASQPGVGAVGPLLMYPDKKNGIQHAGIIVGMGTMAGHVFRHHQPGDWTDFGVAAWPRNYLAVTGACLAIKKTTYKKMGGLDEIFTVAGQDVSFGIKLYESGYRNIFWPFVQLYHYENVSVGTYDNGIQLDYDHSLEYYAPYHKNGDPYFNPNLDLMNEQVAIRSNYEKKF